MTRRWRGCGQSSGAPVWRVRSRICSASNFASGIRSVWEIFREWMTSPVCWRQSIALARGFMGDQPLLLVLDEPTAALDAETEHALFERYAAMARGIGAGGRITILVSQRF